jgi:hypothetical protein
MISHPVPRLIRIAGRRHRHQPRALVRKRAASPALAVWPPVQTTNAEKVHTHTLVCSFHQGNARLTRTHDCRHIPLGQLLSLASLLQRVRQSYLHLDELSLVVGELEKVFGLTVTASRLRARGSMRYNLVAFTAVVLPTRSLARSGGCEESFDADQGFHETCVAANSDVLTLPERIQGVTIAPW